MYLPRNNVWCAIFRYFYSAKKSEGNKWSRYSNSTPTTSTRTKCILYPLDSVRTASGSHRQNAHQIHQCRGMSQTYKIAHTKNKISKMCRVTTTRQSATLAKLVIQPEKADTRKTQWPHIEIQKLPCASELKALNQVLETFERTRQVDEKKVQVSQKNIQRLSFSSKLQELPRARERCARSAWSSHYWRCRCKTASSFF